jgi:hypothetical protein
MKTKTPAPSKPDSVIVPIALVEKIVANLADQKWRKVQGLLGPLSHCQPYTTPKPAEKKAPKCGP